MMANFTVESRRVENVMQRYERKRLAFFLVAAIIGVALRFAIASYGYNYDMGSHRVIADMVAAGKSVYTTQRYNYGPVWFHVLHYLDMLPSPGSDPLWALRWKIVAFLT